MAATDREEYQAARAQSTPGSFCSQCGERLSPPGGLCPRCLPAACRTGEPGPMLARANLLRMRGLWTEAADLCVEVLRGDPANPTAHSLLGDIYQDQGRPEEARYWYQLALELNPGSEADRAKLSRTEETLDARRQRAEWEAVIEGRAQPVATSLLVRESLQRVGALAGAAVCGIILVLATIVSVSERTEDAAGAAAAPEIVRPRRGTGVAAETPAERQLLDRLNAAVLASGSRAQVIRLQLDPRTRSASLRVYVPVGTRPRQAPADPREVLMREGYRLSQALLREADASHLLDYSLAAFHVDAMGPAAPEGGSPVLFSGTLLRNNLVVQPERVTREELRGFYSAAGEPRWAPGLGAAGTF